jgi:uncharacterized membrane protein required for colicin V production
MNILLIVFALIMLWRIAMGMKRGIVREVIAFVNVIFAALVLSLLSMTINAYHAGNYLGIALFVVGIVIVSVTYSILKIVFFPAKIISKLPVVSSADKLLGVLIGIAETLIVYWTMCCLFMYLDLGILEEQFMAIIKESTILTGMYEYNLLGVLLDALKAKLY